MATITKRISSFISITTVTDGADGENSVRLEISNEYDMVPTNSSGKVTEATTIFAMIHLWDGATLADCPQLTVAGINVGSGTLSPTITEALTGKGYVLSWEFTTAMTLQDRYDIGISVTYQGKTHQGSMTIAASKGRPRYCLSYNFSTVPFKKDDNNVLTPATRTLKVGVERYDGEDYTFVYAAAADNPLPVKWSRNGTMPTASSTKNWGTATNADRNAGISFDSNGHMVIASSTTVSLICIALFNTDGTLLDQETIGIVKDGTNGNSYAIILDTSNVSYANGKLNASIICHAILDNGSGSSDLGDTGTMKYAVGSDNGAGLPSLTYSSGKWNLSLSNVSYATAPAQIILKYYIGNVEVACIVVPVSVKGEQGLRGKTGRMYYYWGEWSNTDTQVTITDNQTPMFSYGGDYWMWIADSGTRTLSSMGTPTANNTNFERVDNEFKFILSEAIFTSFAKFGSFVVSGDWMISTSGTIGGVEYGPGDTYNNAAPYTYFDAAHPHDGNGFIPKYAVDGRTGKTYMDDAYVKGKIVATRGSITGAMSITGNLTIGSGNVKILLQPKGSGNSVGASIKATDGDETPFSLTFFRYAEGSTYHPHGQLKLESQGFYNGQYGDIKISDTSSIRTLYQGDREYADTYTVFEGYESITGFSGMVHKISVNLAYAFRMGITPAGVALLQANAWPTVSNLSALPIGAVYRDGATLKVKTS